MNHAKMASIAGDMPDIPSMCISNILRKSNHKYFISQPRNDPAQSAT